MIDHTLLKADATESDIKKLCEEAKTHGFYSVCINPTWISVAKRELLQSSVKICTVIGFPLGASDFHVKAFETHKAIEAGANEIDMVLNIGALKSGFDSVVLDDMKAVVDAAEGSLVKVILETCYLSDSQKQKACELAVLAGAQFVKTSTGFGSGGATIHDVEFMRRTVGTSFGVKASGGIKSKSEAEAFIKAGANRLGTSRSVEIAHGAETCSPTHY